MSRETFAEDLGRKMFAGDEIGAIWRLHVAAAKAYRGGRPALAAILIEIADATEREWRLHATGQRRDGLPAAAIRTGSTHLGENR